MGRELTVNYLNFQVSIGPSKNGLVNMSTTFNPFKLLTFVEWMDAQSCVADLTFIVNYQDGTGEMTVMVKPDFDEFSIKGCVEAYFQSIIL